MRNKVIFSMAILGVAVGMLAAYLFGMQRKPQPPVFKPASSPYQTAIFANGIIESDQSSGSNTNVYPEVSGRVAAVLVKEGQPVSAGVPLVKIDDSVQKQTTAQLYSQAKAALALLSELRAQPRKETLDIAQAQVRLAEANVKSAGDQYDKDRAAYDADPHAISKNVLDVAQDALQQANSARDVARRQLDLTKAGAWSYDIDTQEKTYDSLMQAYESANALLAKYTVTAGSDGVVLAVSIKEIVRSAGYSRGLVRKVLRGQRSDVFRVRSSSLEAYLPWLDEQWAAGRCNGSELWRSLKQRGFRGCLRVVSEWSARRRRSERMDASAISRAPSARTIARLMTIGRDQLSKAETVTVAAIESGVEPLVEAREVVADFQAMIRRKVPAELDPWIERAKTSLVAALANDQSQKTKPR